MIFVIALAIIVILTALLLVYAQEMRTESTAAANQVAAASADTVEQGAEQWVMAQCETFTTPVTAGGNTIAANVGFGQTDITTIPAAGLQVGDPAKGGGYFWCLSPNPLDDQNYYFGIQDEGAKVNLNRITLNANNALGLLYLPGMTQDAADCITDWTTTGENPVASDGAKSDYYEGLGADAYDCKDFQFDTVDELLLVKGVTPALLYGQDLNRDGVIDANEAALDTGVTTGLGINGSTDRRGFYNYVTTYSTSNPPAGSGGGTGNSGNVGKINVNTASEAALMTLPGISQSDADSIIAERTQEGLTGSNNTSNWVSNAIGPTKYQLLTPRTGAYITGTSYQYSADIVAVSGDGRAFKRVRIVVDVRAQPATIVYRKDLTDLGWPLPADVKTSLRAGQGIPPDAQGEDNTGTIGTSLP